MLMKISSFGRALKRLVGFYRIPPETSCCSREDFGTKVDTKFNIVSMGASVLGMDVDESIALLLYIYVVYDTSTVVYWQ